MRRGCHNKIIHACESKDYAKAYFAALALKKETAGCLMHAAGKSDWPDFNCFDEAGEVYARSLFPDLTMHVNKNNLDALITAVEAYERVPVKLLESNGVAISRFASVDEFAGSK